jgi:hypothetical protein
MDFYEVHDTAPHKKPSPDKQTKLHPIQGFKPDVMEYIRPSELSKS